MSIDTLKHAQRERVLFLDQCLTWRGHANRRDLIQKFDISTAQAAVDFRTYLSLTQTPPIYNAKEKSYFRCPNHRPLTEASPAQAFDLLDDPSATAPAKIPLPEHPMDHTIIAALFRALRGNQDIQISYTSINSGVSDPQWIGPAQFHFDGETIYLRAWSYKHTAYRDYLPIRISKKVSPSTRNRLTPLPFDTNWNSLVRLWIRPRSTLSEAQAQVVRREFGFEGASHLKLDTRKALVFYVIRRWRLGEVNARLELEKTEILPS